MTTDETLDAVRGDLLADWPYREHYRTFIGPRCPECGKRGCSDSEHLEAVRAAVQATMTVAEVAGVLGVTEPTGGRS